MHNLYKADAEGWMNGMQFERLGQMPIERRTSFPLWPGIVLSVVSGVLLAVTMPGYFNAAFIGWIALVPLLLACELYAQRKPDWFTIPFGIVWSVAVHNWYTSVFSFAVGTLLMIGAGIWYAFVISLGIQLQRKLSQPWRLLALPVVWTAMEFAKFTFPIVNEWWFVLLAKSQWGFPAGLQILSVTGFPGLSFILMLFNVALTRLMVQAWHKRRVAWPAAGALVFIGAILVWGMIVIPAPSDDTFRVLVTADQANAPDIQRFSNFPPHMDVHYADTPEMSQAIFDVNATLTEEIITDDTAFVVWPENEFADADDPYFMDQVKRLARNVNAYVVVDAIWRTPQALYDTAVLIAPDGQEVGRQPKTHLFPGEKAFGFSAGNADGTVFETPYGLIGLGVCYDYHFLDVVQALARNGADIVLMPTDDDMEQNPLFPYYHATDAVFRAVEHRVTFAAAGTNGVSLVVDPYGRITASSGVNTRMAVAGETFTVSQRTLYTRLGDWFGWLVVMGAGGLIGMKFVCKRKRKR